jgi:hypothetical protein
VLGAPRVPTPSRPPRDGDNSDVSIVLDVFDGDTEERTSPDRSTRGLLPEWDVFELHDQLLRTYTTSLSRSLRLFNRKPFLPPWEGEMSWALQKTVRTKSHLLPSNTDVTAGIWKNTGIWITNPTPAPLAEEIPSAKVPQAGARTDPSPHS